MLYVCCIDWCIEFAFTVVSIVVLRVTLMPVVIAGLAVDRCVE